MPPADDPSPDERLHGAPDRRVVLTRRTFLIEAVALVGTGVAAGLGAAAVASSLVRSPVSPGSPGAVEPPGNPTAGSPSPAPGAEHSPPAGVLPTPSGATLEPIQSAPAVGPGRARRENLRKGTDAWELPLHGKGNAEAYASDVSLAAGEHLSIAVASPISRASITLYRLGWYGGRGARVVARWRDLAIPSQLPAATDPVTGLIRANWSAVVTEPVSEGWVSGLYVGVVSPVGGAPQYFTLVVREMQPAAPILFVSAATTHQAYNDWGGKSLYPDSSTGPTTISGGTNAVTVSWERPYDDYRGAGLVLRWEYPFVRWMESRGYDVAYAADIDLERYPELVAGRRLIVFAGHPEYWSVGMRDAIEGAISAGTNVAFFSANEMFWRVRFDAEPAGRYRTVTCYRRAEIDPMAASDPVHATTKWREPPSIRPESLVIGQMYGHIVLTPGDFVCTAPDHWIYADTGLRAGDGIVNLVGQEYDRFWPDPGLAPVGTQILAASPVLPNLGHAVAIYGGPIPGEPSDPVHNATMYTAPSGATVFSAGTIQWSWALDDWGSPEFEGVRTPLDSRVARITSNVLDRLGG